MVAAAFGVQAVAIGLSMTAFPVFLDSIENDFGATRTQMSFGVPLIVASGAFVSPWIGRSVDRGSPRRVMICGAFLMMFGLVGLSSATSLIAATAAWVCLVGTGQAMLGPLPSMTVIANWFVKRRATMIAVAAMGTTFGGGVVPPIAEWLIRVAGWRGAVFWMGMATVSLGVPIVWFGIRKSPEEVGAFPDGAAEPPPLDPVVSDESATRDILGDYRFWPVAGSFALLLGLGVAFLTHLLPLSEEKGIPREVAVGLLSVAALGSALGKLTFGALTDRLGPRRALFIGVAVQMFSWGGLIASSEPVFFGVSTVGFAFGMGCTVPIQAGFVAMLFGRARFGRATGLLGLFSLVGVFGLGPLIGWGYDETGNYVLPMSLALVAIALPALLVAFVRFEPALVDEHAESSAAR